MARTPIDVYRGLVQTRLDDDAPPHMHNIVGQFSDQVFLQQKLSDHLNRFLELWAKLLAYLDSRYITAFSDLEASIDVLDYFTSATKWWTVSRKEPGLIFRPPSHEPREFLKSIATLKFSSGALSRILAAVDKLTRFLDEHKTGEPRDWQALCNSMHSSWTLLSAFACMSQGRNVISENDFETAYDIVRVLLFYLPPEDFLALTAIRKLGTNRNLSKIAATELSTGFERKLGSSIAARLERDLEKSIAKAVSSYSGAFRNMLTDSLRILVQIQVSRMSLNRVEEGDYESLTLGAIDMLERSGISQELFREEKAVASLFKKITPAEGVAERVALIIRRLEGLIGDSIGNRDFLLQYNKLVPRMISLLLLLASSTKTSLKEGLQDIDLKRGLILFSNILNM